MHYGLRTSKVLCPGIKGAPIGTLEGYSMDELEINENSALIFTSFAGYTAEQDIERISKYCRNNDIMTIEDASAGIGDKKNKLGNGKYSDIIIASTGSPKMINVGSGGFITSNNEEIFKKTNIPHTLFYLYFPQVE